MQFSNQSIARTVDYIEAHLADKLTLGKIAAYAGYSKYHLNRLFAEETGCTIHQYIQNRRLTEAARRLVETDDTILEISFSADHFMSAEEAAVAYGLIDQVITRRDG